MSESIQFIRDLMIILLSATCGGWLARRLGLSAVVGYLAAGLVIGTPQITFIYVTDPARIKTLSEVGLVLLMFAIGMGIRIREIREMGFGPIVATCLTALLMLTFGRIGGSFLGLDRIEGLFFAAMLMVSSSAIIGKILTERHLLHQRVGQYALSQTLLEDFVAVILLAVLGSITAFEHAGPAGGAGLAQSLGKLGGFILLVFITGLVLLPKALATVRERGGQEMHILLAGGLVFGFAFLSVLAGYSLALGAFLFGMLVAENAQKHLISRSFSGMRDIFAAIFFVAIGMGIDLTVLPEALDLILWGSLLALLGRILFSGLGWMAACQPPVVAFKTSLHLTPIGEFSFIIAGFGIASGILTERFQIAAVGISFVTSLLAPVLMGQADRLTRLSGLDRPGWFTDLMQAYGGIWARFREKGSSHVLWKFLRRRLWQIGREVGWVSAVIVFAQPLYGEMERMTRRSSFSWLEPILPWFWMVVFLLLLIPIVSVIRNIQAMAMLVVDYYSRYSERIRKHRQVWTFLIQGAGVLVLILFLGNVLPWWFFEPWTIAAILGFTLLVMLIGWNRLIRLHSQAEVLIQGAFDPEETPLREEWETTGQTWGLALEDFVIPEDFAYAGRTIAELGLRHRTGATIVGIERQGIHLGQPGPSTHVFPGDKVFLIGSDPQLQMAFDVFRESSSGLPVDSQAMTHAILESVSVPPDSSLAGKRLQELNWPRLLGVHVVAVRVNASTVLNPGADWVIAAGSDLLLAGSEKAILEVRDRLI